MTVRIEERGLRIESNLGLGAYPARISVLNPRFCTGFTLLELIVVISIVAIMASLLLNRISYYQEQAEKAAMQQVEAAVQTALIMRYSALIIRGAATQKELGKLVTENPLDWLQQKPRNYAGEYYDPTSKAVAPGNWMFDLRSRDLIYVVSHGDYFTPGKDGNKWVRFHVRLGYDQAVGRPGGEELTAMLFEPTEAYHWLD